MSGLFDQITNYSPPLLTAGQVNYKGTWNAATNSPTLVSPPASTSKGDYYVVSAAGTQFGITFAVGDWIISNGTAWEKVDLTDAVSSVFGRTGAITAASGDYTASQVTNVPAGTISSTNVQDAINELSSDIATAQNVLDAYVTNAESVAITKGQVVYAFGATGNRMSVKLANNSADATSAKTVGVVLDSSIAAGNPGYIRMVGVVDGLNLGTFTDGDTLYLGATNGSVTATKPYAPNHLVYVGIVERANNGNGQLYVKVQNGYELDEIHDVQITSAPASGALLVRDATNSLWKAARLTAGTNIAVTNADASVTVGITGIIGSSNGGTGNGFTKFSGPATSEKTFTLPNSNATLLYDGGALGTPSSGTVTNLTGTASININGTVGATTANTGAFTTVNTTGNVILGGGADFFNGSVRISDVASSTAPAYFQSGEPGVSVSNVILSNNYYGSSGGASGRKNTSVGASYIRLNVGSASTSTTTLGFISASGTQTDVGAFSSTGLAVTGTLSANDTATFDKGTGSLPPVITNAQVRLGQADNTANGIQADSYGSGTGLQLLARRAGGTRASPSATNSGSIFDILAYGHDGTAYTTSPSARYQILAQSQWSGTNRETRHLWTGTANGSTSAATLMTLDSTGLAVTGALSTTGNITLNGVGRGVLVNYTGPTGSAFTSTDDTSGSQFIVFTSSSGTTIGSVSRVTTTSAVTFNTTSDARLKENFRDLTDSGRLIDSLKPRVFDWKNSDENGKNVVGFIAQETNAADPIFAHIGAVSIGDEDPDTITKQWQRSDSALIPILVAELKALRQRVAALESK